MKQLCLDVARLFNPIHIYIYIYVTWDFLWKLWYMVCLCNQKKSIWRKPSCFWKHNKKFLVLKSNVCTLHLSYIKWEWFQCLLGWCFSLSPSFKMQHQRLCHWQFDNILLFFLNTKFYDIKVENVPRSPLQISQFQTWNEKTLLNLMYANFILTKFFNAHIGSSQSISGNSSKWQQYK